MGIKYFIVFQNEDPSDHSVGFVFQTRQIQFVFNISDDLFFFFFSPLHYISLYNRKNRRDICYILLR